MRLSFGMCTVLAIDLNSAVSFEALAVDWRKNTAVTGGWDANIILWNLSTGAATQIHECGLEQGRCSPGFHLSC